MLISFGPSQEYHISKSATTHPNNQGKSLVCNDGDDLFFQSSDTMGLNDTECKMIDRVDILIDYVYINASFPQNLRATNLWVRIIKS
jgi:hypothetical protein